MVGRRRTWLVIAATGYLVVALVIGLWPTPVDAGIRRQLFEALGILHHDGLPGDVGYSAVEFTANILFFVPIGVLLTLLLPPRIWWPVIPTGALISGLIELLQLALLPARYASWGDIAANTIGAVVGVAIVLAARARRRLSPARRARPEARQPVPGRSQVP
jgi:hypothetical protein